MSDTVEYNAKGLKQLLKALKDKMPVARVGVLSSKDSRAAVTKGYSGETNAEIGAKHEFGTDGMPVRSFLRVPIAEHLQQYLEKAGAFDEDAVKRVIAEGSLVPWVEKVGLVGEDIVQEAFDTGGFGQWKPSNMKYKHNQQTLVETTQLRKSIASEVIK